VATSLSSPGQARGDHTVVAVPGEGGAGLTPRRARPAVSGCDLIR